MVKICSMLLLTRAAVLNIFMEDKDKGTSKQSTRIVMAKGEPAAVEASSSTRAEPDSSNYGTVYERERLLPFSVEQLPSASKKKLTRLAMVVAGCVILIKLMMLLASWSSARSGRGS
ncbi:hypothetical protein GUITHDRAFT_101472 [Guillardia theta CCMP2712]|uniref:Uncharacterized protein n=1 Tax=Guillardia theta (strain CCMP2712) TaxID=905079 RepID=L1JXD6_GUITC|nr:hypothetical protein GUITHDRAFT_101472 [Guillardia theta CCMP2712]EKX53027.1 hypothetical protein GUITHDRAFT_101472 [Guillardia theta CCMP2712]|eukprot:XP_005840007.1 hypothetical protein GUITHDRAFT_101472 [Guillardia theta CCMP2712]